MYVTYWFGNHYGLTTKLYSISKVNEPFTDVGVLNLWRYKQTGFYNNYICRFGMGMWSFSMKYCCSIPAFLKELTRRYTFLYFLLCIINNDYYLRCAFKIFTFLTIVQYFIPDYVSLIVVRCTSGGYM